MPLVAELPETLADSRLARAAVRGEAGALDRLVVRHYGTVYAFAVRMLGDAADARDATQETFVRMVARLDSYDPVRPFPSWLLSIAANLIRDRFRRRRPEALRDDHDDALAIELPPETRLIREEDRARVLAAVDALPFDLRVVVALVYQEGRDAADAASVLAITPNAVRIRLFRALARLRDALKESR